MHRQKQGVRLAHSLRLTTSENEMQMQEDGGMFIGTNGQATTPF